MKKDVIIGEEEEASDEQLEAIFEQWYRRPTWVQVSGEYQVINRNTLLAVIRAFRKLRRNT